MNLKHYLLALVISLILSIVLYGNTLGGEFVHDDFIYANRQELRNLGYIPKLFGESYILRNTGAGVYRPLTLATFSLNFALFGESTLSFHLVNIVLNALVVFLVFLLAHNLFKNPLLSACISLIFAFLPIHTEAVSFIKSRDELLSSLLALLAWLTFLKAKTEKIAKIRLLMASSLFFLLAVLAKETIFIAPLLFLAVFWLKERPKLPIFLKTAFPFVLVGVIYLAVRFSVLGKAAFGTDNVLFVINPLKEADLLVRFLTAFKIAFILISKTIIPYNLSATYTYNQLPLVTSPLSSWQTILGASFLTVLTWAIFLKKTPSALKIGSLTFLIPYLVVSKFIFLGGEIAGERWMYFPSIGASIIIGFALYNLYRFAKRIAIFSLLLILVIYWHITFTRNAVWASEDSLYRSMLKTAPNSILGYLNVAIEYLDEGNINEAEAYAQKAAAIYQNHPPLLNFMSYLEVKKGNLAKAEELALKSTEIRPDLDFSRWNLGLVYYHQGRYQETYNIYKEAVRSQVPYISFDLVNTYALTLAKLGLYEESVKALYKYAPDSIGHPQARFILAVNFYKTGNFAEAKKYFNWDPAKNEAEKIKILEDF